MPPAGKFDIAIQSVLSGIPEEVVIEKAGGEDELDRICGARPKDSDTVCKNPAGSGTDHPGSGRCYLHGGNSIPGSLYSDNLERGTLKNILDRLRDDERIFNLREHIRFQVALQFRALEIIEDIEDVEGAERFMDLSEKISRNIERLQRIEEGEKYTVSIELLSAMASRVADIVAEYVDDEVVLLKVSRRLQSITAKQLEFDSR